MEELPLVLLDLNGILAYKTENIVPENRPHVTTKYYKLVARDGIEEFFRIAEGSFNVGIYSSTFLPNIKKFIDGCMSSVRNQIKIIADCSVASLDPGYGIDKNLKKYDTVKTIERIIYHPILNADRKWNFNNVLIVDHEERKLRFVEDRNRLILPEYKEGDTSPLLDIFDEIVMKLSKH